MADLHKKLVTPKWAIIIFLNNRFTVAYYGLYLAFASYVLITCHFSKSLIFLKRLSWAFLKKILRSVVSKFVIELQHKTNTFIL
jgi:hypothetical protein